jgi:hypothetical protein
LAFTLRLFDTVVLVCDLYAFVIRIVGRFFIFLDIVVGMRRLRKLAEV